MISCENQGPVVRCECGFEKSRALIILNLLAANPDGCVCMLQKNESEHEAPSIGTNILSEPLPNNFNETMKTTTEKDAVLVDPKMDLGSDHEHAKDPDPRHPAAEITQNASCSISVTKEQQQGASDLSDPHPSRLPINQNVANSIPVPKEQKQDASDFANSHSSSPQENQSGSNAIRFIASDLVDLQPSSPHIKQNGSICISVIEEKQQGVSEISDLHLSSSKDNQIGSNAILVPEEKQKDAADVSDPYPSSSLNNQKGSNDIPNIKEKQQDASDDTDTHTTSFLPDSKVNQRPLSPQKSQEISKAILDLEEKQQDACDVSDRVSSCPQKPNSSNAIPVIEDKQVDPCDSSDAHISSPQMNQNDPTTILTPREPDCLSDSNDHDQPKVPDPHHSSPKENQNASSTIPLPMKSQDFLDNTIAYPSSPQKNRTAFEVIQLQKTTQRSQDYSINIQPEHHSANHNLQLCKLYAQGNCNAVDCVFLHSEFPCKHYYLNIAHDVAKCRFSHGPPLDDAMRYTFMRHLESNSAEMLGDLAAIHPFNLANMFLVRDRQLQREFVLRRRLETTADGVSELSPNAKPSADHKLDDSVYEKLRQIGVSDLSEFGNLSVDQIVKSCLDIKEIEKIVQITKDAILSGTKIENDYNDNSSQSIQTGDKIIKRRRLFFTRKRINMTDENYNDKTKMVLKIEQRKVHPETDKTLSFSTNQVLSPENAILSPDHLFNFPIGTPKMPFEPFMPEFVPATEIHASLSNSSKFKYRLIEIDVPKLDTAKLLRKASSRFVNVHKDPRLNRISSNLTQFKTPVISKLDPRRRLDWTYKIPIVKSEPISDQPWQSLDRTILLSSGWYADLSSSHKIMVNQQLAILKTEMQAFHMKRNINQPYLFDLSLIKQNPLLQQTLVCLNLYVDENGYCQKVDDRIGSGSVYK